LGQLTNAVLVSTSTNIPNQNLAYTYDALGNRVTAIENGVAASYTANNLNQYLQVGTTTLNYDADGSLTQKVSGATILLAVTNNFENRVIGYSSTNGQRQFSYDALGFPSVVWRNGVQNIQVQDPIGFGDLEAIYDGSGNLSERQFNGLGTIGALDGVTFSFLTYEGIGNVTETTTTGGVRTDSQAFRPFGQQIQGINGTQDQLGFCAELGVIQEGDLDLMRARFYDSGMGRFLAQDPIGVDGRDANFYRYVGNAPTTYSDPTGLYLDISCTIIGPERWGGTYGTYTDSHGSRPYFGPSGGSPGVSCSAHYYPGNAPGPGIYPPSVCASAGGHIEICQSPGEPPNYGGTTDPKPGGSVTIPIVPPWPWYPNPPTPPTNPGGSGTNGAAGSLDPNTLTGPTGFGSQNYVAGNSQFAYQIDFQNATNATAPTQVATVSNPLTNTLDWTTFQLTEIAFGNTFIAVPSGSQHYANTLHLTQNGFNFDLQIDAGLNPATGLVYANFTSVNPTNGLPPPVTVGFLLPEDGTGRGQGQISYTVRPKAGLSTGTQIRNVATITFDINSPIATDLIDPNNVNSGHDTNKQAMVTIDATAPTSSVTSPSGIATNTQFTVSWSGSDTGSGIANYDIYLQTNGGPWAIWLSGVTTNSALFYGQYAKIYGFYSVAHDAVGNVETAPLAADVTVTVQSNYPPVINAVANGSAVVGRALVVSNSASDPDLPIKFSLDAGDPAGISINKTNGVLAWTPVCEQGSTTNLIKVWATDSGTPPMSNSVTFTVVVSECLQVSIGSTAVQIGQASSVPVNLLSTVALTNLNFTLAFPTNRFTNWVVAASNTVVGTTTAQTPNSSNAVFGFGMKAGQILQGPAFAGNIGFAALSNSSAFVPLTISGIQGTKSDGTLVGNTFGVPGRVVVIGNQPLLEAWMATNRARMMTIYGNPGASYQMNYSTNLANTNWFLGWRVPQTNLSQIYEGNEQAPAIFYRALQFSANPSILELNSITKTNLTLLLYGENGTNYLIQGTTNLSLTNGWVSATNVTLTNSFLFISSGSPTNNAMFFRAKRP
jgi:RHS repeat-associated protein